MHFWPKFGNTDFNWWWLFARTSSKWGKFWLLSSIWPWSSRSIVPQSNRDLNQGLFHLWSKFGDSSLNGWWVIARTSWWLTDRHTHTHTHTQATTIPEGQNWPRVKKRAMISSVNFLCIGIMGLWLYLYKYVFITSLMASPGHKVGNFSKLMYSHQYFSWSVDQKLQLSEILMAFLVGYSTSGITFSKKSLSRPENGGYFDNFEILNTNTMWPRLWKDRPKLCQNTYFSWWWRHRWPHRVASKFPSIFMFSRGWPREQVPREMSRQ